MEAYSAMAKVYNRLIDTDYDMWTKYVVDFLPAGCVSVADCACGTGEITVRLAKLGYGVTGADISGEMLEIAQRTARGQGQKIPYIKQDMRGLRLHKPVDAIICCMDGVNYLTSQKDADAFFRSAFAALKTGGRLIFDISSEYKLANILGNNTFAYDDGETAYIWFNGYSPKTKKIAMQLSVFTKDGDKYARKTEEHVQKAHCSEELKAALIKCGFEVLGIYGDFTKKAPKKNAMRIHFVAVKGKTDGEG